MNKKALTAPFIIFIIIGTIIPLAMMFVYAFTNSDGGFTLENIAAIAEPGNLKALGLSLLYALISTLICLVLAFPICLILKNVKHAQAVIVFIFLLPMWMNFLLRTMAWQVLLEKGGVINSVISALGFEKLRLINTPGAVIMGMVYDFLPFMILSINTAMSKIDNNVIEAALDLGAKPLQVDFKVILPLSIPGIVSGITMVFVPALTTFVISNMLGGGKVYLIGNIIEQEFTTADNWNLGAGLSVVMMVFIVISMLFISKFDKEGEEAIG